MSKKSANIEGEYPELAQARAKLAGVMAQLQEIDAKLEEAFAVKREHEERKNSVLKMAEAFLEGDSEALPKRDIETELKNLLEKRGIIQKAAELQQAKIDEIAREAASQEYRRLKPRYLLAIKKMMGAVGTYRQAVESMDSIRAEMTSGGLPCALPPGLFFPGWTVANYEKKRDALAFKLKQAGLEIQL